MFEIKPKRLYHAYKEVLSDYRSDIASEKWKSKKIESVDTKTGEIKELPLYVFEPQNIGEKMSIDDKGIGGYFIAANYGIKDKDFVLWRMAKYFA
ncbi:MAG: hypothetical protein LBT04_01635 [Prevotellaceae bacterium]|jgi:hypothetical protein|nr:hypothetical protein [Prevotellaceae bacterium]